MRTNGNADGTWIETPPPILAHVTEGYLLELLPGDHKALRKVVVVR